MKQNKAKFHVKYLNKKMNTSTEENYLKAIYKLSLQSTESVSTNAIADEVATKSASVTDMLKKLYEKKLINYQKYQGVSLTEEGLRLSLQIVRRHRLWEVFLREKLGFSWDKIHDIAEQLEHVKSEELTEKLSNFLGNPQFDPHGDPIPDAKGKLPDSKLIKLSEILVQKNVIIMGVSEHSAKFLQHLEKTDLIIGKKIMVKEINDYDQSMQIESGQKILFISHDVAKNILVKYS